MIYPALHLQTREHLRADLQRQVDGCSCDRTPSTSDLTVSLRRSADGLQDPIRDVG